MSDSANNISTDSLPAPTKRRDGEGGYYTSADYHALYKSGELTPTAVVEGLLPLIRRDTSPKGEHSVSFIDSKADIIRAAAAASTQRYKTGTPLGPLDGVPVAVKDEVDLEGYKRTLGTTMDWTGKTNETSWCVKKWEEAGAVVIGKTTMHELGLGKIFPLYSTRRRLDIDSKLTTPWQIPRITIRTLERLETPITLTTTLAVPLGVLGTSWVRA